MATGKEKAGPSIFKKSVGIAPVFLNTGNTSLALILGGENPMPQPVFYGIILENNKKKARNIGQPPRLFGDVQLSARFWVIQR